jgi:hypothetical protein
MAFFVGGLNFGGRSFRKETYEVSNKADEILEYLETFSTTFDGDVYFHEMEDCFTKFISHPECLL